LGLTWGVLMGEHVGSDPCRGSEREGANMATGVNYHGVPVAQEGPARFYLIARAFAQDHWQRDCGEGDVVHEDVHMRGVHAHRIGVSLDVAGYEDMLSDARYYADMRDELTGEDKKLADSAARVVKVLTDRGAPN
jgi:hypothetical protein